MPKRYNLKRYMILNFTAYELFFVKITLMNELINMNEYEKRIIKLTTTRSNWLLIYYTIFTANVKS